MSPVVDETAGDLPVRDVGLMRGGLMPVAPDTLRNVKAWKKHCVMKTKANPQRLFRFPREHLEDLCLRLQEENSVLRQHTRTQEQRLRRMSTRLMRLRQTCPGSSAVKEREMEDTVQELEARVAMLESQKEVLQNKLSLAKQHIVDLRARTPYKYSKNKNLEGEVGVRRVAQTAPPRYGVTLEDTKAEMERLSSVTDQVRMTELELTAQTLRDTLTEKEKEVEGTIRELRKQQVDRHRTTIRENVDLIRLQKQLSEKSAALRVSQEKFNNLQEAYEKQLEETHTSLKQTQEALLEKVEELTEQLKQERQKALTLDGQLTTMTLSLQTLDKLQERISDLEGERDLIKKNYDTLLISTLSAQSNNKNKAETLRVVEQKEKLVGNICSQDIQRLEEMLRAEREERSKLELETEKLRQDKEALEEQREQTSVSMKERQEHLEQEVVQYKQQVFTLQDRLNSISKEFDMSIEELSETFLQIKAFRMQQESREGLSFLVADDKVEDSTSELVKIQASYAETVLELQKTRNLLLLEHKITTDLQQEVNTLNRKVEQDKEENRRGMAGKDKLLSKRALQINTLQAQLKELAYRPRSYKRAIPIQYTWPEGDQEVVQPIEDDLCFSQLKTGESLLEIHLKAATFTPTGLRVMSNIHPGADKYENIVTFCTYSLLDFEMHSTPLVSGSQPNYGFTSRYALTARDLGRLGGQGSRVRVELHQALGGVRFVTHGSGHVSLMGAMERRGERISGGVSITSREGEMFGVVDFWVCLFPPVEPTGIVIESGAERRTATQRDPVQILLGWQDSIHEELHDYGGGIPNELVVMLERCVGLNARWPGILPDAYLTYRLYDLPPHTSHTVQCATDPVFNDVTSYPLAVTTDVLHYFRSSSLWVYVFDDSDDQMPPAYLAKTPIPLRALATGSEIRGDYVLRDPAGGPRGMVRVMLKWKYPFHPPVDALWGREEKDVEEQSRATRSAQREEKIEESQKPVAKPRVKTQPPETKPVPKETKGWPQPALVKQKSSQEVGSEHMTSGRPQDTPLSDRRRSSRRSVEVCQKTPHQTPASRQKTPSHKSLVRSVSRLSITTASRENSVSDVGIQDIPSVDQVSVSEAAEEEDKRSESGDTEASESTQSDVVIITPKQRINMGDKLRVEILSLTFEPSSNVALDQSVQRVYVEYRMLGVPMETTETPMSLRKPLEGEEIHYNFTRVIYVDSSQSAPLRQYLYTMLEGRDPNQGRLKFTVVSEPMDDDDECVEVGHAFLDLQELLLTGNDVIEQQIDILSVDEDKEVIGYLKVSLEAAKALTGIYQEFHQKDDCKTEERTEEKDAEKEEGKSKHKKKKTDHVQVQDYGDDSVFY